MTKMDTFFVKRSENCFIIPILPIDSFTFPNRAIFMPWERVIWKSATLDLSDRYRLCYFEDQI